MPPRPVPAFRASRSRLLAEPPLGEPQPCDIDINPLAHHSGSRLPYLRLLSLIATAQGHLVDHVADYKLIGDPLRHLSWRSAFVMVRSAGVPRKMPRDCWCAPAICSLLAVPPVKISQHSTSSAAISSATLRLE